MMKEKETFLLWSLVFLLATVTTIAVVFFLSFVPDSLDMQRITEQYVDTLAVSSNFTVETSERLQYVLGTVAFFLSFLGYGLLLKGRGLSCDAEDIVRIVKPMPLVISLAATVYLLKVCRPLYISWLGQDHFTLLFLGTLAVYLAYCCLRIYGHLQNRRLANLACLFILLGFGAVILYFWTVPTYWGIRANIAHHMSAYFYPVYQVWCGNTPGVDFHNLYGFYPYLLTPVLHLLGGISDVTFSTVMACMTVLCAVSLYCFLAYVTKNHLLALIGSCAAIYVVTFYSSVHMEFYIQFTPHRLFFPAVSLLLIIFLDRKVRELDLSRGRSWLCPQIIGAYAFSALALFWNVETGLAVLLGFSGYLAYRLAYRYQLADRVLWKGILRIVLLCAASAALMYGSVLLISWARTGRLIEFSDSFYGLLRFAGDGFFLQPMPVKHPWVLLIGLYAVAAARAMAQLRTFRETEDEPDSFHALTFFLSVLGILVFLYYQGRSHDYVFPFVTWPGFVLAATMVSQYLRPAEPAAHPERLDRTLHHLTSLAYLAILVIPVMCMALGILQSNQLTALKAAQHATEEGSTVGLEEQFIRANLDEESLQSLDIIAGYAAALNMKLGITDILPISDPVDWFLYEDVDNVLRTLARSDKEWLFWENSISKHIRRFSPDLFTETMSHYEQYAADTQYGFLLFRRVS